MDYVLAIIVMGAVIFFGALISAGNEHQRKALEGIREQAAQWAVQDLRLKREKFAREVKVDDPLAWLNQVAAKVTGELPELSVIEVFNDPQALVCTGKDGSQLVFSPVSPEEVRQLLKRSRSRLSRVGNGHPLLKLPHGVQSQELSILNGGIFFDLELPLAWERLAGLSLGGEDSLWLYRL